MDERETLVRRMRTFLLLTGIAGVLVLAAYMYIGLNSTYLISASGIKHDNNFGMTIPVFASAIAAAYSLISFRNLGELIKDGAAQARRKKEFHSKFEKYIATTEGLLLCTIFSLAYWVIYTRVLNIVGYLDTSSKVHDITVFSYSWSGLMLLALIMSIFAVKYALKLERIK